VAAVQLGQQRHHQLNHINIIRYFRFRQEQRPAVRVLEYVDGPNLRDL